MIEPNNNIKYYNYLEECTNLAKNEISIIIKKLLFRLKYDPFYIEYMKNKDYEVVFSKEKLINIITYLKEKNIDEESILCILRNTPELLFFSDDLDNIYMIYKANTLKGYLLNFNGTYRSYRFLKQNNNIQYSNGNENIPVDNTYGDNLSYNYIVDEILSSLRRDDIAEYYKISQNESLKEILEKISRDYSKKNYYLKKVNKK